MDQRASFQHVGLLSCPDPALALVAARARRIRLVPAVTVLPPHHPIRVAEQWASLDLSSGGRVDFTAGRGYDWRDYGPFGVSFERQPADFRGGSGGRSPVVVGRRLISDHGWHYHFGDIAITLRPVQRPIASYVASFSQPSIELAARLDPT
jgi:alkanesulfonate monooxygenase SsuD/methylene tetrahydromethanopterin reductase-like flavin-dependent oxidoreductase (luciferase family)